jgi:D-amino-acid dehydrogenase
MKKDCVIIGGGIIGFCTAYYLAKDGHKVTILDKGNIDSGASFVNAGYITPSHFMPLSSPGIITKGLKWMLDSRSPFYVKPRLDPDFLNWAWCFRKSATAAKVEKAIPVLREINLLSRELYQELKDAREFDFSYNHQGLLMCYKTDRAGEEEAQIAAIAAKGGMEVSHFSKEELNQKYPDASYNVEGAYFYDTDAHMTPDEFMQQMREYLVQKGVEFRPHTAVEDFVVSGNRIEAIETSQGRITADEVILTAGTWSSKIAGRLGLRMLLEAGKGYSFNLKRETGIKVPSILVEAKVAVTPMNGFTRFAGTMELGGINHNINKLRVETIAAAAGNYFDGLQVSEEEKGTARAGLRPCSPDGLPYIGRTQKIKNLSIGTGHAMMGWSLGPATGKILAEVIGEKKPTLDLQPFSPDRKF